MNNPIRIQRYSKIPSNPDLNSLNGLVYLMFVHRETHAWEVSKNLKENGIILNESNVIQTTDDLLEKGLLKEVRTDKRRKIRAANLKPFEDSLRSANLSDKKYQKYIVRLSEAMNYFPSIYAIERGKVPLRRIKWDGVGGSFIRYLFFLNSVYCIYLFQFTGKTLLISPEKSEIFNNAINSVKIDELINNIDDLNILVELIKNSLTILPIKSITIETLNLITSIPEIINDPIIVEEFTNRISKLFKK